ncbi:DUF4260 domain-containing protein [Xanthocytophaga flava]|uniref:DUF4260 domain-containing protein n=1 Tax=Xanthocytophaga flava TaxID=3048013 RepID=UPI0028D29C83|nr:DUF4260 domain-containing protein [Xanthocytophaga flavus]MDJ1466410.1 DUF4260 domain-containing protein [Xanthocytophaga flavus]
MKLTIKLEEIAMFIAAVYFLSIYNLGLSAWVWFLLFFAPDLGMLGYIINTRIGALTYNLFHHKGIAISLSLVGYFLHNDILIASGALLVAHAAFDRMLGFGLKYDDNFKHTHLSDVAYEL